MTSNVGSDIISRSTSLGFTTQNTAMTDADVQDRVLAQLRKEFRPEFLNRIHDIVVFRRLDEDQLRQITGMLLEETRQRLRAQNITVEFAPVVVDWLVQRDAAH